MILEFAHTVRVLQEFYSGKEQTLANIRRIVPGTYQSPVGPEIDARDSYEMLFALADALESVEGRKIVVFLSMNLQTFADPRQLVGEIAGTEVDQFPGRKALDMTRSLREAILQLNHANATLYMVDLTGVYGNENNILNPSLNAFDVLGNPLPVEPNDHPLTRMEIAANIPAEGGAASLAIATGGTYFPNQTNFAVALNRIGIQNQLYYLLSFSPTKTELDGEYRQIAVRVRDRPDLRVIARPGYFARRRGEVIEAAARGDYGYAFPEDVNTYAYLLNPRPHGAFGVLAAALPESSLEEPAELRLRVVGPRGDGADRGVGPGGHPAFLDLDAGRAALGSTPARVGRRAGREADPRRVIGIGHSHRIRGNLFAVQRLPVRQRGTRTGSGRAAGEAGSRLLRGRRTHASPSSSSRDARIRLPRYGLPTRSGTPRGRSPWKRSGRDVWISTRGGRTAHPSCCRCRPRPCEPGATRQSIRVTDDSQKPLCGGRTRVPNSVSGSWAGP